MFGQTVIDMKMETLKTNLVKFRNFVNIHSALPRLTTKVNSFDDLNNTHFKIKLSADVT